MTSSLVEQVAELRLNHHTSSTILGKPFPSELGPSLPPDNAERVATVEEVIRADESSNSAIRPVLELLCQIMQVETACVALLTDKGTFIKEGTGLMEGGKTYTLPGICQWTLVPETPQAMVVEDMLLDARTSTRWVVKEPPFMRFYAAAPLLASTGHRLGTLCLWDQKPRSFDSERVAMLCNFSELVARELEASAVLQWKQTVSRTLKRAMDCYHQAYLFVDVSVEGWQVMHANQAFCDRTGMRREDAMNSEFWELFRSDVAGATQDPWSRYTEELKSKQSLKLDSLQCRRGQHSGKATFTATLRPASTDKVDGSALMIGVPSGSLSEDSFPLKHSFYFVIIDDSEPAVLEARTASTKALRLGALLGAGTYGRVYRGMLGREKVAVKVVDITSSLYKIGNMPLEAALMQGLVHPCIVALLEHKIREKAPPSEEGAFERGAFGRASLQRASSAEREQQLWLVLQYCDKGSLEEAVDKGAFRTAPTPIAPPSMATILQTALEIAQGLAFLHSRDILHCDISSANVLLHSQTPNPHGFAAKLADFGACVRVDMEAPSSENNSLRGTFTHVAPEVVDGQPCSKASDVYAFGALLYEMYCGQHPWAGLQPAQVVYALVIEKQSLQVPEDAPAAYRELASSCMSREVEARPNADDIMSVLEKQIALLDA
ncbi:hypothetical protein WJX75_004858 [Coccomyxa subellipsoidea]|uniref:Protein kinase domain-containing protein n=1 Tax=Coccomyxa subellipsoidea TaxID=248742 RepID=A0ABR2Z412_9CHLO